MAFQSTPTNFMAGDPTRCATGARCGRFNPRPPISWRATRFPPGRTARSGCFNPRPPISWRATVGRVGQPVGAGVSIHAHQFHGGRRRWTWWPCRQCGCFNPRPPISWRATCRGSYPPGCPRRFNPRPPISWRATGRIPFRPSAHSSFNPRPPISWRATARMR